MIALVAIAVALFLHKNLFDVENAAMLFVFISVTR